LLHCLAFYCPRERSQILSKMVRQVIVLVLAMLASPASSAHLRNGEQMRPDVVANTLVRVEDEWRKQAAEFTEGSKAAPDAFAKSCSTVVSAVIQGSAGDRTVAKEYMNKVCSQKVLATESWRGQRCTALANSIAEHAMLADNYANRQNLNPMKVCTGFWSVFVKAESEREAVEAKERAEHEKVQAELEKKAEAAEAEAKKKATVAAKIEEERRVKEEARHEQELKEQNAKIEAAEAKGRAAEVAARLAQKRAEAEKMQKEAQLKLEEAEKAEKEHKERLAEHQKAEEQLHKASKAAPKKVEAAPVAAVVVAKEAQETKPAKPVVVAKEAKAAEKVEVVAKAKPAVAPVPKVDAPAKVAAPKK